MTATRWWSASKHRFVVLEEMHNAHLLNAFKKFELGEYLVPDDPDDPLALREPTAGEANLLRMVFDSEMAKRSIGPYAPADEQAGA